MDFVASMLEQAGVAMTTQPDKISTANSKLNYLKRLQTQSTIA